MQPYVVIDKKVGETPLQTLEKYRAQHAELVNIPMAYAGRLDPMASGKLLVLIGDECKHQKKYHALDKEYAFSVLFGISSDTGDVLGLVTYEDAPNISSANIRRVCKELTGNISLPYPHFSSKTVHGKPLHTWTLENRLNEINIPTASTTIHKLTLHTQCVIRKETLYQDVTKKIETIPKVTDKRKELGNDFRRPLVRKSWGDFYDFRTSDTYHIAEFTCTCSSGTYMRSLAGEIATKLDTKGLAYTIHRTKIGVYFPLTNTHGFWTKKF